MSADVVFINGEVITVDKQNRIVEGVAVKDNRIVAVGSFQEVQDYIGEETEVIDLEGKTLLPGFIDSHVHLTMYGVNQLGVNCKSQHIESIEDIFAELRNQAEHKPKGEWIRASGFNEMAVKEKRYPTIAELDAISTDHPIIIARTCGHISIANTKALELAGIDEKTPDPKGGMIHRGHNGQLTGRLIEAANMYINSVAAYSEAELRQGMKKASDHFIAAGITSVHDAGAYGADSYRILQQAINDHDVRVRVYALVCSLNDSHKFVHKMVNAGVLTGTGDERFRIGPVKLFVDGSSTGPTLATRAPYTSDPNDTGILYYKEEEIYRILGEAHKKGYQITVHAQGDRAIEMYLNCVEKALEESPRNNHRHRIEHAGISSPDLQERMKALEVIPIVNPPFPYEFGDIYVHHYGERVNDMYPARDFIDKKIIAAAGSDSPVTHFDPLLGIHTAVNRKSQTGKDIGSNQCISVLEAIRLYTWNGAYASFEEDIKGSIEVGKLADLVVLSDNILNIEQEKIKDLKVELTMIDGDILYQREKAGQP
ncbi:putative amidohydrolase YtcJ [Scopulibacillus daqui]|uniref:Amidohydrolase YtcJ n=1 Tax=Scopulibacillus daqui TaxID=1469162 RepID=A0ABS2Q0V8_9BACL|nr:amidohydrolase [Scopulibacillus daqui]MBM7645595.1 putative amidohydrolase YtcJ [Scopulibacillus daqui]